MRKKMLFTGLAGLCLFGITGQAQALAPETEMLLQLLQAKGVITAEDAANFKKELAAKTDEIAEGEGTDHYHSVKGIDERLQKIEEAREEVAEGAAGRIQFSGRVEVEAGYNKLDSATPDSDEESSEIHLATAELDVDAVVNPYVSGHLAFLWEDEGDDPKVDIDEGIVSVTGGDKLPLYCNAGKMYIPFGRFESHFITDPATLTLGETNERAVLVGYANDLLDLNLGLFNGKIDETGHGSHNNIDNFFASAVINVPVNAATLSAGASYTSNLASSDSLRDLSGSGLIEDYVGGFSVFANLEFLGRFNVIGEYLSATDDFALGDDLGFIDADNRKPSAWNVEVAATLLENLEGALRYGGTDEFGDEELEKMYGAALLYNIFDYTSLTLEYLQGELQNNDDVQTATLQVAVEF